MTVAGLVLAAGGGRRYGRPKAPVVVDGERLVDRAVRVLSEAGCAPVVVVLGAWTGDVPGARVVDNPDWETGMGSSLRAGLAALADVPGVDGVVVSLVDLPGLTADAVRRLVLTGGGGPEALAAATFDGARGHPVLLGRGHWAGVAASAAGDRGARAYLDSIADDLVLVELGHLADGTDLDHPT
ncbi:MAG: nucleotidyltransferase family protein [Candidatus Nanopelagicales bacterium]